MEEGSSNISAGGDVFVVHIGDGNKNVVVGKNIVQEVAPRDAEAIMHLERYMMHLSFDELREVASMLGQTLAVIADVSSPQAAAYGLVQWAERNERLEELCRVASSTISIPERQK